MDKGRVPGPAPSRFDPYYRTHDTLHGLPSDAQSVVSQAVTSFPLMPKGKNYPGYASSIISQQPAETASVIGGAAPSIAFSQFDRLPHEPNGDSGKARRRLSFGSVAPSDAPTASMYAFGYKAGDDDVQSIAPSQAGMTEF